MRDRRPIHQMLLIGIAILAVACTASPSSSSSPSSAPTPNPSPSLPPPPSPTPAGTLSEAQLKYVLLERFGPISWCDPDFYPVAHADEQVLAEERLPEIQANAATYQAIRDQLGMADDGDLSDADKLAIYREWKLVNAVHLESTGDGVAAFDLITIVNEGLGQGLHTTGTIGADGTVQIAVQEESFLTSCPICLARGTLIDTPAGSVPVDELRPGDLVWTVDGAGRRVAAPLLKTGSTPVPDSHRVVHLVLDDGRELWVSPGHPLTDGRSAGDLKTDDRLDGALVRVAELVGYDGGATFDILPDSATGYYWANGIVLGSTLR